MSWNWHFDFDYSGLPAYDVRNLDDYDPATDPPVSHSLRKALLDAKDAGGGRVIFRVAGTLALKAELQIWDNTWVAGETAPYPGYQITGHATRIKGSNVRYGGIHHDPVGHPNPENMDAFGIENGTKALDSIEIYNITARWACDETLSIYTSGFPFSNIVVRDSLLYEAQRLCGHPDGKHNYGLLIGNGGAGEPNTAVMILRNVFAHFKSRNPQVSGGGGATDAHEVLVANNVVYNFGGVPTRLSTGAHKVAVINNRYIPGPDTPLWNGDGPRASLELRNLEPGAQVLYSGNIGDEGFNTTADIKFYPSSEPPETWLVDTSPLSFAIPQLRPANDALYEVLATAGPKYRDEHDWRVIGQIFAALSGRSDGLGGHVDSVGDPQFVGGEIVMPSILATRPSAMTNLDVLGSEAKQAVGAGADNPHDDAPDGRTKIEQFIGKRYAE